MAGASLFVEFDDSRFQGALERLLELSARPETLLRPIGSLLVASTTRRFATNVAPDGSAWPQLNRAYDAYRRSGPMLVQSSALRNSITFVAGASELRVGSNMIYAAVHQFGAVIKPKNAKALAFRMGASGGLIRVRSVTIPARPYLGISDDDAADIVELTQATISRLLSAR
jgi:phage virion morphogenesis protein